MNFAAAALVGLTLGQPPSAPAAPDYYPLNFKTIKIPIKYDKDRKAIRQALLFVAPKGENTWYQEAAVTPDRDEFTYAAKEDGVYWFTVVIEDLQGKKDPADLTRTAPDLKVLVDTVAPRIQFTTGKRAGDEVIVEWAVDDKHPDEAATKVHFRPAGNDGYWQEVTLPAGPKTGVRFPAGSVGTISVRVTTFDLAGNKTEAVRDVAPDGAPAAPPAASSGTSTSMSPVLPTTPRAGAGAGTGAIPPPDPLGPTAPTAPSAPAGPTNPPATPPAASAVPAAPGGIGAIHSAVPGAAIPPVEPRQPVVPAVPPASGATGGPMPVAVWTGGPPAAAPTVEVSRAHAINYLAFDLGYELEARGPSGISRLDLWVTRDDGRTWLKWSQHDGKAASVKVNLNVPANPQQEGNYGFRVVPVSGAGLSEREPAAGDAPDLKVTVDITPPKLDVFPPIGDPANPDTLIVQWKAADKNFGDDPITLEWSDKPAGPWQPVAAGGDVVPVAGGGQPQVRRLANTGQHAWRVPAGLPPRVFLKVTARDAAGNVQEVVTREPVLVDLVKPRAKISGIVGPTSSSRPQ